MQQPVISLPGRCVYPSPGFSAYWEESTGLELLQKLGFTPKREDTAHFSQLYAEGDPEVDLLVEKEFSGPGQGRSHKILGKILKEGIASAPECSAEMQAFFEKLETVPDWADFRLMDEGAALCQRAGISSANILRNYSLMGGYESSAINKPLIFTGALKKGAAKRMQETYEFWVHVTGKGAMKQYEPGYRSAAKVRFIHAIVRYHVQRMPEWSDEKWGAPLNQGDMVATHLGFTLVYLVGLRKMGFQPTKKEITGLFQLWKYIGFLMGIRTDFLPEDERKATELLYHWTITQPGCDEDTHALAQALVEEPLHAHYPKELWQRKFQVEFHLAFNRHFLGNHSCERIGLRQSMLPALFPQLFTRANAFRESILMKSRYLYDEAVLAGRKDQEQLLSIIHKMHPSVWT